MANLSDSLSVIIGILMYYALLVISLTIIINGDSATKGFSLVDNLDYNDDLLLNSSFSSNNPFLTNDRCTGKGQAMSFLGEVPCWFLDVDKYDYSTCNSISGCYWENATIILGLLMYDAKCNGYVNKTIYNITPELSYSNKYCSAIGLQNIQTCDVFKCSWISADDQFNIEKKYNSDFSSVSVWQTISWILTFRFSFGFDPFFNVIINFILVLVIPLCLFIGLYYVFHPFK